MATDFDLRDVILEAQADITELMREVMIEIQTPQILEEAAKEWYRLPADKKAKFKEEEPAAYAALMNHFQGEKHA